VVEGRWVEWRSSRAVSWTATSTRILSATGLPTRLYEHVNVDMDAFYAMVEIRDRTGGTGRCVGGIGPAWRGVSANYLARGSG